MGNKDRNIYIAQLQEGCWLTTGEGDPPRTLVIDYAKKHPTYNDALQTISFYAKRNKHRSFRDAKVVTLFDINVVVSNATEDQTKTVIEHFERDFKK